VLPLLLNSLPGTLAITTPFDFLGRCQKHYFKVTNYDYFAVLSPAAATAAAEQQQQ